MSESIEPADSIPGSAVCFRERDPANTFFVSGAGPAGLAAALTIAKAGGRAAVFERQCDVGGRFHGDFQEIENWSSRQDVLEDFEDMGIDTTTWRRIGRCNP